MYLYIGRALMVSFFTQFVFSRQLCFHVNANQVTRKQRFVSFSTCEAEVAATTNTAQSVNFIRDGVTLLVLGGDR